MQVEKKRFSRVGWRNGGKVWWQKIHSGKTNVFLSAISELNSWWDRSNNRFLHFEKISNQGTRLVMIIGKDEDEESQETLQNRKFEANFNVFRSKICILTVSWVFEVLKWSLEFISGVFWYNLAFKTDFQISYFVNVCQETLTEKNLREIQRDTDHSTRNKTDWALIRLLYFIMLANDLRWAWHPFFYWNSPWKDASVYRIISFEIVCTFKNNIETLENAFGISNFRVQYHRSTEHLHFPHLNVFFILYLSEYTLFLCSFPHLFHKIVRNSLSSVHLCPISSSIDDMGRNGVSEHLNFRVFFLRFEFFFLKKHKI